MFFLPAQIAKEARNEVLTHLMGAWVRVRISDVTFADLPTLPVFPGVSKFFISQEISTVALVKFFFINFITFLMSKRKIKEEVDLVYLFELFLIRKRKQSNRIEKYLTSTVT